MSSWKTCKMVIIAAVILMVFVGCANNRYAIYRITEAPADIFITTNLSQNNEFDVMLSGAPPTMIEMFFDCRKAENQKNTLERPPCDMDVKITTPDTAIHGIMAITTWGRKIYQVELPFNTTQREEPIPAVVIPWATAKEVIVK